MNSEVRSHGEEASDFGGMERREETQICFNFFPPSYSSKCTQTTSGREQALAVCRQKGLPLGDGKRTHEDVGKANLNLS